VPTELPQWDTRWVVPAEATEFPASELLPPGLSPDDGGDAFRIDLAAAAFSRSLAELCPECGPLDGLTVPKPPFTVSLGQEVALPEGLLSATLSEGAVGVRIRHEFPFDPLRPGATARGYLVLEVLSGSTVLARDSLSGTTTAFPPATELTRTLTLQPGPVSGPLEVRTRLSSPLGDPVLIDLDDRLSVEIPSTSLRITSARLRLENEQITSPSVRLELDEVDASVADRVQSGAVLLAIDNPFDLNAALELRIATADALITKNLEITPGTSQARIDLAGDELRSLLGHEVDVSVRGEASTDPEGAEVQPDDVIGIEMRLELVIRTGGG
jgi:hypothetical protein